MTPTYAAVFLSAFVAALYAVDWLLKYWQRASDAHDEAESIHRWERRNDALSPRSIPKEPTWRR